MGKTSSEVKNRWNKNHYSPITVQLPIETVERFREKCKAEGISQTSIIRDAIEAFLEKEEE